MTWFLLSYVLFSGGVMRKKINLLIIFTSLLLLGGCGGISNQVPETKVIISLGFENGEIFKLDTLSCYEEELQVYVAGTQQIYTQSLGSDFLEANNENGELVAEQVVENALANISQIKAMCLLADQSGIFLTDTEKQYAEAAAESYEELLNKAEHPAIQIDLDQLNKMYQEYALANKLYDSIIQDINPEISDDEARTTVVQHIFLKNYSLNGLGEKIPLSDEENDNAYQMMIDIRDRLLEGEDFNTLSEEYSDDETKQIAIGKGDASYAYEQAAFSLAQGEISDVIETSNGYYIIECISTFDFDETQKNKEKIIEERKKEVFENEYRDFVDALPKYLNEDALSIITCFSPDELPEQSFFDVYKLYFSLEW